ncbi:MAG TPA: tetratricopeptide repeat protein [Verrucomicrobiae bacterium]|nr:tetratricopeptide repeat protein [Verrucomicrobiae bacterium]
MSKKKRRGESSGLKPAVNPATGLASAPSAKAATPRPATLSRRKKWAMRAAAFVLVPVVLLGGAELVLRVAGYGHSTRFLVTSKTGKGFTLNPWFTKRFFPQWNPGNSQPFFLPEEKGSNTVRIFILGESAALGTPSPAFSFGRMIEVMLRRQYPERRFEVCNAAMRGINSHVMRAIAADCARHEPDLFIVYAGNNELVGLHGADPESSLVDRHLWLSRAVHGLQGTRLGQWLGSMKKREARETQDMDYFRKHRVAADDPARRRVYENFAENLKATCRSIERSGAKGLLLTVGANLKDFPPLASLHKRGLSEAQMQSWTNAFAAGAAAEEAGRFEEAAGHFEQAAAVDNEYAELNFRLGRCHLATGRVPTALQHVARARDTDALPFRPASNINDAIRDVKKAGTFSRITLVDVEARLGGDGTGRKSVVGDDVFLDHVHFRFAGDYGVARLILPSVMEALTDKLGAPRTNGIATTKECTAALGYNAWEEWQIASAIANQLARAPFLDQLDHARRQAAAEKTLKEQAAQFTTNDLAGALAVVRAAIEANPEDWQLKYNLGMMTHLTGDQTTAAAQFRLTVERFPEWPPARLMLGQALARAGRRWEAEEQFQECLRLAPDFVPAQRALQALAARPAK